MTSATTVFLFDGLRDANLLGFILGGDMAQVELTSAVIVDSRLIAAVDGGQPMIASSAGAQVDGFFVSSMSEDQAARLAFYYAVLGCLPCKRAIMHSTGCITAQTYIRPHFADLTGADWRLHGAVEMHWSVARDVMAQYADLSIEHLAQSRQRIYARAHSVQRAAAALIRNVGSQMPEKAVQTFETRTPYRGFVSVEEHDLSFQKFDGTHSKAVTRAALVSSDAAIVLPYDPITDRVLLVEQFRFGPHARGDRQPWCLEPIAGLIDAGETPEQAAIREAKEEAGLDIRHLEIISQTYPSPGLSSEFFYLHIGLVTLPVVSNTIAGLASESEDIRSHVFAFDDFMRLIDLGQFSVGPTVLAGLWLSRHRDRLRALG
ncbi:MAG: NUDIX hydrolase [Paracoccaceae bacterium]|nr:NUDIX hydrolase [Paracoccaceae bacterium]